MDSSIAVGQTPQKADRRVGPMRWARRVILVASTFIAGLTVVLWIRSQYMDTTLSYGKIVGTKPYQQSINRDLTIAAGQMNYMYQQRSYSRVLVVREPGVVFYSVRSTGGPSSGLPNQMRAPFQWSKEFSYYSSDAQLVSTIWVTSSPLWAIALVTGMPGAFWLVANRHRFRRRRVGECATCGYDLRASPDRCPERGTSVAVAG